MLAVTLAAPASARVETERDRLGAYVAARAADAAGDPATAARLLADLVGKQSGDELLRRRAVRQAIEAGEMGLALQLAKPIQIDKSTLDLRLLWVAEELKRGKDGRAVELLRTRTGVIHSSFLAPFVEAWIRAERRDPRALDSLGEVSEASALFPQRDEHRALLLLKLKRPAESAPLAERVLTNAGGRAERLRLAFADGFRAAGDKGNALKMLDGGGATLALGRARIAAGKSLGQAVDDPAKAYSELLLGLALALNKLKDKALPIAFAQIAHYANPDNGAGTLLLGLLLDAGDRSGDALTMLRSIPPGDPFAHQAQDAEVRILTGDKRGEEALARARQFAAATPSADSFSRLGAALSELDRHGEAADAYGRAVVLAGDGAGSDDLWSLRLFRASALESAGRWDEAKAELAVAMQLSPDNPLLLNFLGYGQLERGENLDSAEAMVRKASALRPDDASITDSLGWAQYKRGRIAEAIETLERAAAADPAQAEIREHLGDAYYSAGRRIEARFAWRAALVSAEDDAKQRIEAKIAAGLTSATAAP